jgi:hypothetical protein
MNDFHRKGKPAVIHIAKERTDARRRSLWRIVGRVKGRVRRQVVDSAGSMTAREGAVLLEERRQLRFRNPNGPRKGAAPVLFKEGQIRELLRSEMRPAEIRTPRMH